MPSGARIHITRVIAPNELGEQIEPKMRNLGNAMGRRAQRVVPKRTWALHDSLETDTRRDGARVITTLSVGTRYWEIVERGLAGQPMQPYLRPALLQSRAGDLVNETPMKPKRGVVLEQRAQRRRDRAQDRRTAARENRDES